MLEELYINNFVLIDELLIQFANGINVLSGETGAGKSIIIDALGLLMGDRINNDFIRDIERKAIVEGVFDVSNNEDARIFLSRQGLTGEDEEISVLILSREIYPGGKSTARINRRPVTVATLKALSSYLVDMHMQNDRQNIMKPAYYIDYVDSLAGEISDLRDEVAGTYRLLLTREKELAQLKEISLNRNQRVDFLDYQINEIESAGLCECEEEELMLKRDRIKNAGKLMQGSGQILELIYSCGEAPSACDQIAAGLNVANNLKNDSFFASLLEPLENIYYSLQELSGQVTDFKRNLDFEPGQLEEIENRLFIINRLRSKYGDNIQAILKHLDLAREEKTTLLESEEKLDQLQQEIEEINLEYLRKAGLLSEFRRQGAEQLERKVCAELLDLNMPNIKFEVKLDRTEKLTSRGLDEVELMFSPNPGEALRPMAKIASGGEISRFILALKTALAEVYKTPTLIFDEIDVGLGGETLNAVARKLNKLARQHQLILVTHSPQVASFGKRNFIAAKSVNDDRTYTTVKVLSEEEKIVEIARMLDGDGYSPLTIEHAREMIGMARKYEKTE